MLHGTVGEVAVIVTALCAIGAGLGAGERHGAGFRALPAASSLDEPGGWGLVLVDCMAERWGVAGADARLVELAIV